MFRKTAFQAMDISLNTFIIFVEIYYVLSKLMLCFYVLKNKAILSCLRCMYVTRNSLSEKYDIKDIDIDIDRHRHVLY